MYLSVFLGLLPSTKKAVIRMQCNVSYLYGAIYTKGKLSTYRSMYGCMELGISLFTEHYWQRCAESTRSFTTHIQTKRYIAGCFIPHSYTALV